MKVELHVLPFCLACLLLAAPSLDAQEEVLIAAGEGWRYFKGTEEPPADWHLLNFVDDAWLVGPTGIGYGDNDDATTLGDMRQIADDPATPDVDESQPGYVSVFCRKVFNVADAEAIENLVLRIDYDDGFVAYLNGVEVARRGLTGTPPPFSATATGHEAGTAENIVVDLTAVSLVTGENVLALQGHNTNLTSSDFSLIPELLANMELCPQDLVCFYDLGQGVVLEWANQTPYDWLEIRRDGQLLEPALPGTAQTFTDTDPVDGQTTYTVLAGLPSGEDCEPLECTVDLAIPDAILIAPGDRWRYLRGLTPVDPEWTQRAFDDATWESGPTGIGYGDADDQTVLDDMEDNYLVVFCRKTFEIDDLPSVREVVLSVSLDDGMVAYVNGTEVARVNMPAGAVTEQTAANVTVGNAPDDPPVELQIPTESLVAGENMLAVSVHNTALGSSDLSFIPTLVLFADQVVDRELFRRSDSDNSGVVNLTDGVHMLRWLFQSGPEPVCLDAADADDSGEVLLTDAVYLLLHLFQSGTAPPAPGIANCGVDPTPDALGCGASVCQ